MGLLGFLKRNAAPTVDAVTMVTKLKDLEPEVLHVIRQTQVAIVELRRVLHKAEALVDAAATLLEGAADGKPPGEPGEERASERHS